MAQATIVVKFGDDVSDSSSYHVVAELDDTLNLDSEGESKTSFNPGDPVYFLVQHDSRVRIRAIRATLGDIQSLGSVSRYRDSVMLFAEINEKQSVGYMGGTANSLWYGNTVGLGSNGLTDFIATFGTFPAIGKIGRSCPFNSYVLRSNVPALTEDDEYLVGIVIYMEVI